MSTPTLPDEVGPRTVHRLSPSGHVRDWLLSPVWEAACHDLGDVVRTDGHPWDEDGRPGRWRLTQGPDVEPVKTLLYAAHPRPEAPGLPDVAESAAVRWRAPWPAGEEGAVLTGTLARHRTGDDGVIERSVFCYTPTYRAFVATTRLEVDQPEVRRLVIASTGPVRAWLGGRLVLDRADFGYMQPWQEAVETLLPSGSTDLVLVSWNVALREVRQTVSVRVEGLPVRVVIPGAGSDERRNAVAEQVLAGVGIRRWETEDGRLHLHGPAGARLRATVAGVPVPPVEIGRDGVAEVQVPTRTEGDSSQASMLGTGELVVRVRVDDDACPSARELLVGHLPWPSRQVPDGGPEDWRREVLEHVAARSGSARALARAALSSAPAGSSGASGPSDVVVTAADLETPLHFVRSRSDCADFEAVGLMLLWHRVPTERWEPGTRDAVRDALVGFKYWIDEPGVDAMCYFTENHQLVWHTAETLVGAAFPDEVFPNAGLTGAAHAEHGRAMARAWVDRKLRTGFSEFDSNAYLAIDALALVALVDHANDEDLARAAEALLDKVLVSLASNSWRGTHGSAHGRSYTPTLRSSLLEETAPIMWLAWGMGALNEAVLPATALATSTCYRVPDVARAIAQDHDADWLGTQAYAGSYAFERDLLVRPYDSRLVVRRGPGGMVSSVQDYRPGLPGLQEHVWGITLPGHLQVWATNPAAANHGSHTRPSAWVGHRVLPRVRQHDRTVIALHATPEPDSVHLWFPAERFDEWTQDGDWLVGAKGAGYVAVACEGGWEPDRSGDEAYQRWTPRAAGRGGSRAVVALHRDARDHADLSAFVDHLPLLHYRAGPQGGVVVAPLEQLDGPRLELDHDGPFLVDGTCPDLADGVPAEPLHLDNPACRAAPGDRELVVEWAGARLRLDQQAGRRVEPPSGVTAREPRTAARGEPRTGSRTQRGSLPAEAGR